MLRDSPLTTQARVAPGRVASHDVCDPLLTAFFTRRASGASLMLLPPDLPLSCLPRRVR